MSKLAKLIILFVVIIGCSSSISGNFRPLNEDEQYIWDMVANCFEQANYDTSAMQPVLIQYVEDACGNVGWVGCAWSEDQTSYIQIAERVAYADQGQYPDFVWTDLNVELFMHEFLHRFGDELLGSTSHEGLEYKLCPQNLWNNPELW